MCKAPAAGAGIFLRLISAIATPRNGIRTSSFPSLVYILSSCSQYLPKTNLHRSQENQRTARHVILAIGRNLCFEA